MNDENLREIYRTLQKSQDKYIYFILAATIASIGFTITQTQNTIVSLSLIPLGISILCWGFSFFFGCRNREYYNSILYANYELLRVQLGEYPEIGSHPQKIQAASEGIMQAIQYNSDKTNKLAHLQMITFILGALFYLIWHILEIYLRT
jgi:hypothetical protein